MEEHYNQNYTLERIESILHIIHECVLSDRYIISLNENRRENQEFIDTYNLTSVRQRKILMQICAEDFCHSLQNTKKGFEHETLYVFVPQVELYGPDDEREMVDIYIKFNIVERRSKDTAIAISFHKRNKPIRYLFERK